MSVRLHYGDTIVGIGDKATAYTKDEWKEKVIE